MFVRLIKTLERLLKSIPLSKVKKDNSNITYYSRSLWKELRKERFRPLKEEQYERFFNYCIASRQLECSPFEDVDFQMDLEKFKGTLSDREGECLDYFLDSVKQEDIAFMMGVSQGLVSEVLGVVFTKFSAFYCENIEEDVGIQQFKKHLSKNELACFELHLDGLTAEAITGKLGVAKSLVVDRMNNVYIKFYAFFGVKING
jgi:hypothetical protein